MQKKILAIALTYQIKLAWVTCDYAGAEQWGQEIANMAGPAAPDYYIGRHYLARTALSHGDDALAECCSKAPLKLPD